MADRVNSSVDLPAAPPTLLFGASELEQAPGAAPLRIAFDLRRIRNAGIGRYMQCLVEAIIKLAPQHEYVLFLLPEDLESVRLENTMAFIERVAVDAPYYSIREQFVLPRLLRERRVDLLHAPHFVVPLVSSCPVVTTIHDIIHLVCKDNLQSIAGRAYSRLMLSAAIRRSRVVITDSLYSKSDLVKHLGADPKKIDVIYCGVDERFVPVRDLARLGKIRSKYQIEGDFILYTGIFRPRKNHAGLLRAFARCRAEGLRAQLVIAGARDGHDLPIRKLVEELGVARDVIFTGFVPESDLPALYSAASVYACPSLYEGFGFTVLEAMACGTPVVSSDATSLPEVVGDAALLADATNTDEFASALIHAITDHDMRSRMRKRGFANAKRFSWNEAARATLAVFEQVAGRQGDLPLMDSLRDCA